MFKWPGYLNESFPTRENRSLTVVLYIFQQSFERKVE